MSVVAFVIGLFTGLSVVAAAYRVVDLWFCIRDRYLDVLARYLRAGITVLIFVWLIPADYESAFWSGMTAYLVLHFAAYYALQVLLFAITRRRRS